MIAKSAETAAQVLVIQGRSVPYTILLRTDDLISISFQPLVAASDLREAESGPRYEWSDAE